MVSNHIPNLNTICLAVSEIRERGTSARALGFIKIHVSLPPICLGPYNCSSWCCMCFRKISSQSVTIYRCHIAPEYYHYIAMAQSPQKVAL